MANKLVIIILNSNPENGAEILEPVYHATIAASMDYNAEIIFAGRAGELVIRGVAEKFPSMRRADETVYDLIKDAYQSGVVIKASKFVVQHWGDNLIAEVSEVVSGSYIVGEIMNGSVTTLSY